MMKKYLFICVLLLCACTQGTSNEPVATDLPLPTLNAELELLLSNINASYSAGLHASEFSCEKCHSSEEGAMATQMVWTDESSGQVEIISSPSQLCTKCHADEAKSSGSQDAVQLAHSDFECTNCHDAHNLEASCTDSTCHADIQSIISAQVEKPSFHTGLGDPDSYMCGGTVCHDLAKQVANMPVYHQPLHRNVPCHVCHDVSGMMVIMEDEQSWMTVIDSGQGTGAELLPQISHTIGFQVQCEKCHYVGNAWSLNEILSDN
jgi:hypothetical protein